ncbi:adenylate/guanylate cyclase domain-containing protein [Candidatus Woesearchaeota archaeon]|nr:adenylate/guanylate cyclase domain-containing protein [Candidatus Woesearchaeota archaeon]
MARATKVLVFFGIFALFALLIGTNAFSHVRGTLSDRLYGDKPVLENIVIVAIDDASINQLGRWPWNRDVHAQLLEKVKDARVIGIDVSFFEPSANDALLNATLQSMDNVVLAAEVQQGVLYTPLVAGAYGYVNLLGDVDGITRRVHPALKENVIPFAFVIAQKLNLPLPKATEPLFINFANKPGSFAMLSAKDVLAQESGFTDKIVLIGATAPNLHDEYFVPTSNGQAMSGVEIHANILQNIINGSFLRAPTMLALILTALGFGAIGFFLIARLKIYYAIPLTLALLIGYGIASVIAFDRFLFVTDLLFAPAALLIFTGAGVSIAYSEEKNKGAYLRDAFSKYVSKELLDELLAKNQQLTLGGEKRTVTVFFSDIRNFTGISERLSPEELVHLLNEYLTTMTRIVLKYQGTVDKFIGDAIMALWNAPLLDDRHAFKACASAVEQIKALRELQTKWKARGVPVLNIGIGIHTGPAVVGNLGSEERFDYTAIGDTINLASRTEGLTKTYGVSIIITESTHHLIKDTFTCRKLDRVQVKGKKQSILLYHLCVDAHPDFVKAYESALEHYFMRDFKEALAGFKRALQLKSDDASTHLFVERCELYLKHPPAKDWDGAFVMQEK